MKLFSKVQVSQFCSAIFSSAKDLQKKILKPLKRKSEATKQLNESIHLLLEDRKRLMDELAKIRAQIETVASTRPTNQEPDSRLFQERDDALNQVKQLHSRIESLTNEREEIVKDRQRLWEEYQKLAESREEMRKALEAKEGGSGV